MDIDPDIANWVLEYIIRQPLDDRILNSVLSALPLPNDNLNLQKSLLLKKLESEVWRRSISESTLELLEQLEEIEFRRGNYAVSDAMKRAYCAVAVDCTLKLLVPGDEGDGKEKFRFFEMVRRLWRERFERMEEVVEKGGLGSAILSAWKDEVEAAVWDDNACKSVMKKFEGIQADEAVRVYLREEREKMGPSFLELVAERVKCDDGLRKIMGVNGYDRVAAEEQPSCRVDRAANGSNASKEKHKVKNKRRNKHVGVSRGAKIAYSDGTNTESSHSRYSLPNTALVNKVQGALESSSMELQTVVKNPLPEAFRYAEAIYKLQKPAEENTGEAYSSEERHKRQKSAEDKLFIVDVAGVVQSSRGNMKNVPKPSLMQRNSSACIYEWDDSIDGSPEDIACRAVVRLPSPTKINTSPLKLCKMNNNLKKRRKVRKWSLQEEDALRKGVEKFGQGSWKAILNAFADKFEDRTEVDLKDKWRNLMR